MKKFYLIMLIILAFTNVKAQNNNSFKIQLASLITKENFPEFFSFVKEPPSATSVGYSVKYISNSGDDANDGLTTATPWKTLKSHVRGSTTNYNIYKFKCDDTFYYSIPFLSNSGTIRDSITSYGTGAKPVFSKFSTIKAAAWTLYSTNIWKAVITNSANVTGWVPTVSNVGFIRLNHGSGTNLKGKRRATLNAINEQWEFYSDFASAIYVYSTANPSTLASSIEVSNPDLAIDPSSYQGFYNIRTEGCSREGFIMNHSNISTIVRKCDIVYIGGQFKSITDSTRQGNGPMPYANGTDITIDSCFVSQTYDCAFSMQTFVATQTPFTRCIFSNNTTDSCGDDFEGSIGVSTPGFYGCRIYKNTFKHAGYSWSQSVRPKDNVATSFVSYSWQAVNNDLIVDSNTIIGPLEGLCRNLPVPWTSRNNDITLDAGTYISKVCPTCSQTPYPWKIEDSSAFVASTGREVGSHWHVTGVGSQETSTYYQDLDQDGYGNISVSTVAATQPDGYVSNSGDCDDTNVAINPGATETCNGLDDNCDGNTDEGCLTFYHDADQDTYGSNSDTIHDMQLPVGYVTRNGDCNDFDNAIYPGAPELCDGKDNDCDNTTDEGCVSNNIYFQSSTYYAKEKTGKISVTVTLTQTQGTPVTFTYTTINGTALSGSDYVAKNGSATITAGTKSLYITITLVKDKKAEPTEYFLLRITSVTGATLSGGDATIYVND